MQWLVLLGAAGRSPVPNVDVGRARRQELTPATCYHTAATSTEHALNGCLEAGGWRQCLGWDQLRWVQPVLAGSLREVQAV